MCSQGEGEEGAHCVTHPVLPFLEVSSAQVYPTVSEGRVPAQTTGKINGPLGPTRPPIQLHIYVHPLSSELQSWNLYANEDFGLSRFICSRPTKQSIDSA